MLSTRTIIGIVIGSILIILGGYFLYQDLIKESIDVNDTYAIGKSTTYQFTAPEHSKHFLNVTANSFKLSLASPRGGLQIPEQDYKNELSIEWIHLIAGESTLKIQNTGDSELKVQGTISAPLGPLQISKHFLVIISGVIIIGVSAAFSIRKPRGF
jgi:hypothetical protein